jgi:hypothetical protein
MSLLRKVLPVLALSLSSLGLYACLGGDTGPTSLEQHQADSSASIGNERLDDVFQEFNESGFEYGNQDLTGLNEANASFTNALQLNPDNSNARLGAALTGVLLALQSEQLSGLVNDAMEAGSPLNTEFIGNAGLARGAVLQKLSVEATFPEIHELQDAVADTLLPVLESAIANLQGVYDDAAFSLTLTIDGSPREIDHAEVAVLLSGFKVLHALSTLVLSYDLDFDNNGSYAYLDVIDGIGDWDNLSVSEKAALNTMTSLLKTTSPLLAVRPAWKARLANVDNNINDALGILRAGMASIKTETDNQANDILRLCSTSKGIQSECINARDLNDGLSQIDSVRKYITQPYSVPLADTTIRVNYAAWLNVQDYKKMLPYYAFYNSAVWSSDKPVFYFTNAGGQETGNANTVADILDEAYDEDWSTEEIIAALKPIIRWQDPTFQGILPGVTEAKLWRIIQLASEIEEDPYDYESDFAVSGKAAAPSGHRRRILSLSSLFDPRFPLLLTGN